MQERYLVKDQSFIGATRRSVRTFAQQVGLSDEPLARLDIISTELATNLIKHVPGGGEIIAIDASNSSAKAVRLLSIDRGSGISDVDNVLIDGFSTAGTMGTGLGAIKRQSDIFEISSVPGQGTATHCTVSEERKQCQKSPGASMDVAGISLPLVGEKNCGDGFSAAFAEDLTSLFVIDGLGHGDGAAEVAQKAVQSFAANPFADLKVLTDEIHNELTGTRGAAMALLQVDHAANQVSFIGVGNITCRIYSRHSAKGCVSVQGIVGERMGSLKLYNYDWCPQSSLLIYSDGIKSAANLTPGGQSKSAILAAAEIYRDFCRTTDDTTVVVGKDRRKK